VQARTGQTDRSASARVWRRAECCDEQKEAYSSHSPLYVGSPEHSVDLFLHMIRRDIFSDWINTLEHLSGTGGLTVNHFPILLPITPEPVVQEMRIHAGWGNDIF